MSHKKVVLIGGKGSCVDIAEEIQDAHDRFGMDIEVLGFAFDDPAYKDGINGWPVLCGTREAWPRYKDDPEVMFVFGMFRYDIARERLALRDSYGIPLDRYLTFIHPTAYVSRSAKIGTGTVILANATIKNNVVLGTQNFVNSGVNLDHDTVAGNDNFFAAHTCIGSGITIGNRNFFGLNCSVRTPAAIGDYNRIGMCANVLNSIGNNLTMIGNPAKPLIKSLTNNNINGGGKSWQLIYLSTENLCTEEVKAFFADTVDDFPTLADSVFSDQYATKLSRHATFITSRNPDGELVGMIAAYINRPPLCYISHVSVLPQYKRCGLFSAMHSRLVAEASERNCRTMRLEVRTDNDPAIAAYRLSGYSFADTDPCDDKRKMAKSIDL